jgi:hypothetical protein
MAVRITYLAIGLGGVCGTLAALLGSPSAPPSTTPAPLPAPNLPMGPTSELTRSTDEARPVSSPSGQALSASSSPSPSATATPSIVESASAPVAAASASPPTASALPPAAPISSADTTPPPANKQALLRAEMHCDQKDAAACIVAARGYETGSAGRSNPEKAVKYRKIALTLWISQCDHNSAPACATLADMYRAGRGVPQSDKNADALVTRTRELCHYNDAPVCHELPNP